MKFKNIIADLLFPPRCPVCDNVIASKKAICNYCAQNINFLDGSACCSRCGKKQKDCICSLAEFSCSKIVSAFIYDDYSKELIHTLKHCPGSPVCEYLANTISVCIVKNIPDYRFDWITEVPMEAGEKKKRGHNQSQILAQIISTQLNIPYLNSPLFRNKRSKVQHKLGVLARYKNARESYELIKGAHITGKVLLIDDVVTTGATLHCCSSLLLNCGAKEVVCATAASTPIY